MAADSAVQLRLRYFGYPTIELPEPVDWNYDPVAGVPWPSSPASKIDLPTIEGDVKSIWELNPATASTIARTGLARSLVISAIARPHFTN